MQTWIHVYGREEHGVEAIVEPAICRTGGTSGGTHSPMMNKAMLQCSGFGERCPTRNSCGSFNRTGDSLIAAQAPTLQYQPDFRVFAYTFTRLCALLSQDVSNKTIAFQRTRVSPVFTKEQSPDEKRATFLPHQRSNFSCAAPRRDGHGFSRPRR